MTTDAPLIYWLDDPADDDEYDRRFDRCHNALIAMLATRDAFIENPDHNFDMSDSEYRRWRDRRDELQDASSIARRAFEKACVEFFLNKDECVP